MLTWWSWVHGEPAGGVSDWLLGSVSHKVAQHSHCSVAVIR
jgi:nucleotide-binding universal stress UspA family protein